jgi:hypothetical protein
MKMKMGPTFPAGIHHHQNNSFDEFRERGYARAHHEDVALWNGTSVGNCSLSFSKSKKLGKLTRKRFRLGKQTGWKKAPGCRQASVSFIVTQANLR